MLLLQGEVDVVGVRPAEGSPSTWVSPVLTADLDVVKATPHGEPLQPGERYEWLYFQEAATQSFLTVLQTPFEVMPEGPRRDRITADLINLQSQLAADGADESAVALAQAEYLMNDDLPADALQAVFAVGDPSDELLEVRDTLIQEICGDE
jgi:hypothetical protein